MTKYRGKRTLIGAWKYVLLDLLFIIPIVGWLIAVCFAIDTSEEHKNRTLYARAFFARLLLIIIICAVYVGIVYYARGDFGFSAHMDNLYKRFLILVNSL